MAAIGRGRGGVWAALLAVLMLLAVPTLSGRAHAAMPSMNMGAVPMARMDMAAAAGSEASAPMRQGADAAICVAACSLAGQLLPAPLHVAAFKSRADARVRYFADAPRLAGVSDEPGSPPPR